MAEKISVADAIRTVLKEKGLDFETEHLIKEVGERYRINLHNKNGQNAISTYRAELRKKQSAPQPNLIDSGEPGLFKLANTPTSNKAKKLKKRKHKRKVQAAPTEKVKLTSKGIMDLIRDLNEVQKEISAAQSRKIVLTNQIRDSWEQMTGVLTELEILGEADFKSFVEGLLEEGEPDQAQLEHSQPAPGSHLPG